MKEEGLSRVELKVDSLVAGQAELRVDVAGRKIDVAELKTEVSGIKIDVAGVAGSHSAS